MNSTLSASRNLSVTALPRSDYIARLLQHDYPPPADVIELGSPPGDQIAALARLGYRAIVIVAERIDT